MIDFSRLLTRIEHRACRLRAFTFAGVAFALAGVACLAVCVNFRVGLIVLDWPGLIGVLTLPLMAAGLVYMLCLGYRANLAHLLLRIDQAAATSERLSSLYEMQQRAEFNPFRKRIEERLKNQPLPWKKGLPVRTVHVAPFATGALLLSVALLLVLLPSQSVESVVSPPTLSTVPEDRGAAKSQPEVSYPTTSGQQGVTEQPRTQESETPPPSSLEDVLSKIWETPGADGSMMEGGEDLSGLIQEQQALAQAAEELLSSLQETLEKQKNSLEEEHRRALEELASKVKNPQLRQALQNIAAETDTENLEEEIKQALKLARELANPTERPSPEDMEKIKPPEQETAPSQTFTTLPPEDENEQVPRDEEGTIKRPADEGTDEQSPDQDKPQEEELDPYGGKSGDEVQDVSRDEQAGFISAELASRIGSTGEFEEFITKGVPLEPGKEQPDNPQQYSINYEALRAILTGRSIPAQAQGIVERYFKIITEGSK